MSLSSDSAFENSVGIQEYTTKGYGVSGIHKQRYSDFIVREIRNGEVCHLVNSSGAELEEKSFPQVVISTAPTKDSNGAASAVLNINGLLADIASAYTTSNFHDPSILEENSTAKEDLLTFLKQCENKDPSCVVTHSSYLLADNKAKDVRTAIHTAFRKHCGHLVETSTEKISSATDSDSRILVTALHKRGGNRGGGGGGRGGGGGGGNIPAKRAPLHTGWPSNLPSYLQFTLLKENVDTMSAINSLAKLLHIRKDTGASAFSYAGTKDKRAITIQQMTVYRKRPSEMLRVQYGVYGFTVRMGDFSYVDAPIRLGDNDGNRFEIILRQLKQTRHIALATCEAVKKAGFINYYGLQRFGKGTHKTHEIGRAVFRGEYNVVCEYLFEDSDMDARSRSYGGGDILAGKAAARCGNYSQALKLLPTNLHTERQVLEGLVRKPADFASAFGRIPKYSRLMYVHAYQSYLWNMAATERMRLYGLNVVVGDLVLANKIRATGAGSGEVQRGQKQEQDQDPGTFVDAVAEGEGEEEGEGQGEEEAVTGGEFSASVPVHMVTIEDVQNNIYDITDVIMPIYGSRVSFPFYNDIDSTTVTATSSDTVVGVDGEVDRRGRGSVLYERLLMKDGLTPKQILQHTNPAYRMGGAYRPFIQRPRDLEYSLIEYSDPNEELASTELTEIRAAQKVKKESGKISSSSGSRKRDLTELSTSSSSATASAPEKADVEMESAGADTNADATKPPPLPPLLALRIAFSLGPGAYATMLLREITKESTETMFQAQLTQAAATAAATVTGGVSSAAEEKGSSGSSSSIKKSKVEA